MDPDHYFFDLNSQLINLQASAYTSAYKIKQLESTPSNNSQDKLPEFNLGDQVLYYQNWVGGRAHKLDPLWIGPLEVTFKQGHEYTIKIISTGRPYARVHVKFL